MAVHFQGQEELRPLDAGEEVDRSLPARQTGRGLSQVRNDSILMSGRLKPEQLLRNTVDSLNLPSVPQMNVSLIWQPQDSPSWQLQPSHEGQEERRDRLLKGGSTTYLKKKNPGIPSLTPLL